MRAYEDVAMLVIRVGCMMYGVRLGASCSLLVSTIRMRDKQITLPEMSHASTCYQYQVSGYQAALSCELDLRPSLQTPSSDALLCDALWRCTDRRFLLPCVVIALLLSMSRSELLTDADIPLQYQLPGDMSHAATASNGKSASIDRRRDRYPFCLVWGPLPLITSETLPTTTASSSRFGFRVSVADSSAAHCVVLLAVIRWLLPFIGHMGICDSEGKVHDFAGPYHIGVRHKHIAQPTLP